MTTADWHKPMTSATSPDWVSQAACASPMVDPEEFFPPSGPGVAAKRICFTCPAATACLDYAIRHHLDDGIWGGLNPDERRAIAGRRTKKRAS